MATGSIPLPVDAAHPADGSTSNLAPKFVMMKGTNTAPSTFTPVYAFPVTVLSRMWFTLYIPTNYASGGTVRIIWAANATTGTCKWSAALAFQSVTAADSYLAHAPATVVSTTTTVPATTARRPVETQISLAGNLDGLAANGVARLEIFRDGSGDTLAVDSEYLTGAFDYVTS